MLESKSWDESARLEALYSYRILDTPQERDFDELVKLAAHVCQMPVALVSLVDRDRQWFKGRFGLDISQTPRQVSFCEHTIRNPSEILEVRNAAHDPRFSDNPLVTGGPKFRYYAGAPLVSPEGQALGTLCVLDSRPRRLGEPQKEALRILSRQVMTQLELRRKLAELNRASIQLAEAHAHEQQRLETLVAERTEQLNAQKDELFRRTQRLQLLNETGRRLLFGGNPDQMMQGIYQAIADHFRTSGFLEFALAPGNQELRLETVSGAERASCTANMVLKLGEGVAGAVALSRAPLVFDHVQASSDPRLDLIRAYGVRAYACYPLEVGERLLGTLSFASNERDEFAPEDRRFFETLASTMAIAKDRYRLARELAEHARHLEQTVAERTAKLSEMMAELRQMSYSMVHEMRAPLRAISSFTDLLLLDLGEKLPPAAGEYIARIQTSIHRMDLLITGALNYNQILQENPPLTRVDAGRLLCDMVSTTSQFQPPEARVSLRGDFPPVLGNEGLLARCLYHLLQNAVTHVPPGRAPVVDVWSEQVGEKVRLCLSDNGTGIPSEVQNQIFELFERGNSGPNDGTGVGLALVRKTVERMQGRLWVKSEPGEGSCFCLELRAAA